MSKGNRTNHKKVYIRWPDWEAWLLQQWMPFITNDLPHLKNDIAWLKKIMIGVLLALVAGAVAVIVNS